MKSFLALLFVASLSSPLYAHYSSGRDDVTNSAAPSSDKSAFVGKDEANTQEYIDTARTGQAATSRVILRDGRCRDADGMWMSKDDAGYSKCVRDAKRVEQ